MASDHTMARRVTVVTKASARANWGREFRSWSAYPRNVQVIYSGKDKINDATDVVVVGWGMVYQDAILKQLLAHGVGHLILDESHEAKSPGTKRTKAAYHILAKVADTVWCLSGTPIPNAPNDLHPMLLALAPERLRADPEKGWPDVTAYTTFMHRYCVTRKKYVGGQWIEYAIKGKNEDELRERMRGFWLRRTQQDVGITKPIYTVYTLHADKVPRDVLALDKNIDLANILDAAEVGERLSEEDDLHLGTLRRLTGEIKAHAVVEAITEQLEDGLDCVVLMAWHQNVIDTLRAGLSRFGVVGIDGRTLPTKRQEPADAFQTGKARVFVGQIQAAGEAIDLSRSAELWFVEPSFTPKDMSQAAMRITNHTQKRQPVVRFCALEGSIDEAFQAILTRKVSTIKQITEN